MSINKVLVPSKSSKHGYETIEENLVTETNLAVSPLSLLYPYTKNAIDRVKKNTIFFNRFTDYSQVKNAGIKWVREETEKAKGINYFIKNKGYLLWFGSATKGDTIYFGSTDRFCQQVYSADDPKLYELFPEYRNTDTGKFDFNKAFPDPYGFPWIRGDDKFKYKALAILIEGKWFVGISNYPNKPDLITQFVSSITKVSKIPDDPNIYEKINVNTGKYQEKQYINDSFVSDDARLHPGEGNENIIDTYTNEFSNSRGYQRYLKSLVPNVEEKDKKEFADFFLGIMEAQKNFSYSYFSQPIFGKTLYLVISPSKHRIEAEKQIMPAYPVDSIVVTVHVPPNVEWFESFVISENADVKDNSNLNVIAPMYFSTTGNGVDSAFPLYFEGPYGIRMITDQFGSCLHFQETNGFYIKAVFTTDSEIDKVKEDTQGRTYLNDFTLSPHAPFSYITCNDLEPADAFVKKHTASSNPKVNKLLDYVVNGASDIKDKFTYQFIKPADKWYWNIDSESNPYNKAFIDANESKREELGIDEESFKKLKIIAEKRQNINFSEHWASIKKVKT